MNIQENIFTRDRIFALRDAAVYPGKDFCDMVFYYPPSANMIKRLWMLTQAKNPVVKIDNSDFKPVNVKEGRYRWVDFGVTKADLKGVQEGFGQLRIFGVNPEEM
jgi:hypothetical protein